MFSAGAAALFAVGGTAFGASNTGTGLVSQAGSGSGAVSGYTISATAYTLNASSPQNTDAIVITYSGSPSPVKVRLSPTGVAGTYYYTEAANPSGNQCTWDATTITCNTTATGGGHQGTVVEVTNLTIVMAQ